MLETQMQKPRLRISSHPLIFVILYSSLSKTFLPILPTVSSVSLSTSQQQQLPVSCISFSLPAAILETSFSPLKQKTPDDMESTGSNSTPPHSPDNHHNLRPKPPAQAVTDRLERALRHRHLLLLHRSDSTFHILGSTANVYTVSLSPSLTCDCPDRSTPCKHILFVLVRVLGAPVLDDPSLLHLLSRRSSILRPCQLSRFLSAPTSVDSLAPSFLRRRFHQIYSRQREISRAGTDVRIRTSVEVEEGRCCPVCLEELSGDDSGGRLVACATCRNPVHGKCLTRWRRTQGRRSASCVICRSRWRDLGAEMDASRETYLNLAPYLGETSDASSNMMLS